MTLTITYKAVDGTPQVKFFKVDEDQIAEFFADLNEGAPFPVLWTKGQSVAFPADKIYEIRIEEENVPEVSEGQGAEASTVGSRETA